MIEAESTDGLPVFVGYIHGKLRFNGRGGQIYAATIPHSAGYSAYKAFTQPLWLTNRNTTSPMKIMFYNADRGDIAKPILAGCYKFYAATLLRRGGATMTSVIEVYEED